jgi:hypothetical protein
MLVSDKTRTRATAFLKKTIGKPAIGYLKEAEKREDNPVVRKQAGYLANHFK